MGATVTVPVEDWNNTRTALAEANKRLAEPRHDMRAGDPNAAFQWSHGQAPAFLKGGLWGSRPYRLTNALGLCLRKVSEDDGKVELDCNNKIRKAMQDTQGGLRDFSADSLIYPFNLNFLPSVLSEDKGFREAWGQIAAGVNGADPLEVRRAMGHIPGAIYRESAMSAYSDNIGGTFVPPPVMGDVAQLMRPVPALQRAGARVVPLPPNGKYVAPKITSPTTGYWITENVAPPQESQLGTGQWALNAKKLGVLARLPNELYRFAAPAVDAALQADMNRTLELGLDYAGLYGSGADEPTGLNKYTGANQLISYTAGQTGANGNTLLPEDGYKMAGQVEERNFDFEGWLFRTQLFAKLSGFRSDATVPGDGAGPFVQSMFRQVGDGVGPQWNGYPVTKSNVIKNTLTKGSATNLSEVWGGAWSKLTIGMYGAIEFAMSNQAGTAFAQDQTLIRGILFADVGTPYPGAFVQCTSLVTYQ